MKTVLCAALRASVSVAAALSAQPALAADQAESSELSEVIVTATRREERLSEVPISITAFGAETIERAQIADVRAISALAPNLTTTGGILGSADIIIGARGISPASFNNNSDATVGIYVDGVYYARTQGTNLGFIDMERVEVLRGPQGTLFGRNTIAGALSITTQKPKNDFEGSVKVGVGNYDKFIFNGVLNVPVIADRLAVRLVYDHQQHDGFGHNTLLDVPLANQQQHYFRASANAEITDRVNLVLTGDYFHSRSNPELWVLRYSDPTVAPASLNAQTAPYLCPTCWSMPTTWNPQVTGEAYTIAGTFTVDLGWATLKSISAYRYLDFIGGGDLDGTPLRIVDSTYGSKSDQTSQEIQLNGKSFGDRLDWIVGAFYFNEDIYNPSPNRISTPVAGVFTPAIADNRFWGYNSSKSIFGQLTYEVVPTVSLTAGVRYVEDTRKASYFNGTFNAAGVRSAVGALPFCRLPTQFLAPNTSVSAVECAYRPEGVKFSYTPWTVGIDFKPREGALFFAKASKGYRSGGFQTSGGSTNPLTYHTFGPENVMSYEVGTKLALFENRLRIGATGFFAKYNEIQQNTPLFNPLTGTIILDFNNAGTAEVYGLEFEAAALLGKLQLNATLGLTDPEFTTGLYAAATPPELRKNPVGVSKTNWSISADYPVELSLGVLRLRADYTYQSKRYDYPPANTNVIPFAPLRPSQLASFRTDGYGLLNGQISLELADRPVTIAVWGRNLTDEYYFVRSLSTFTNGSNAGAPGEPRTYGATIRYQF